MAQLVRICLQFGRPGFDPWVRKIPWRRAWQPTPVFLPGEPHGQGSLVGYSTRDHKESDMTQQVTLGAGVLFITDQAVVGEYEGSSFFHQFSSVAQSCPALCNPMDAAHQASLSISTSHSLLNLMSIESVMPSNHLILCHALLLLPSIFPSIRVFSNQPVFRIRWPKYWSFSFSISPSNEYSGLIFFRMDWLDLPRVFSNTTVQKHQFLGAQLSL